MRFSYVFCGICLFAFSIVANAATNDFIWLPNDESNDIHAAEIVKSPVIMCSPVQDAMTALESYTGPQWDWANIASGTTVVFENTMGPFASATITLFNPPNGYLHHHFNSYGQIESVISTAEVQTVSFEVGVSMLDAVKHMYEEKLGKDLFETKMGKDGAQYQTKSLTASGWRIILSVKRLKGGGCFFKMEISRRRFVSRKDTPMPEVELALP